MTRKRRRLTGTNPFQSVPPASWDLAFIHAHQHWIRRPLANQKTPLLHCIEVLKFNATPQVDYLLQHNADPNHPGPGQERPLHVACQLHHSPICKLLLTAKASVHVRDLHDNTPLQLICRSFHKPAKLIKMLLEAGADINALNDEGFTPATYIMLDEFCVPKWTKLLIKYQTNFRCMSINLYRNIIRYQDVKWLEFLLRYYPEGAMEIQSDGSPLALRHAYFWDQTPCLKVLLATGLFFNSKFPVCSSNTSWGLCATQYLAARCHITLLLGVNHDRSKVLGRFWQHPLCDHSLLAELVQWIVRYDNCVVDCGAPQIPL